jgi:hypothetical protein
VKAIAMRIFVGLSWSLASLAAVGAEEPVPPPPPAPAEATATPAAETPAPPPSVLPFETPPPTPVPTGPPDQMRELDVFLGTWTCAGTYSESMAAPTIPMKSELEFKRDLRGYWLAGKEVRDPAVNPPGEERLLYWSYDRIMQQYVGGWLASSGSWSTQTSFGFLSEQITMWGHISTMGNRLQGREVFKRPVDGTFTRVYELLDPATNEWLRVAESTCRKNAPKVKEKRR